MEKENIKGLTSQEVNDRIVKNLVNYVDEPKTKTIKEIVKSNVFTSILSVNVDPDFLSYRTYLLC